MQVGPQTAQACELRRVIVYCSIFLNTLNLSYLIVKICDKMYYSFNKNYLPNRHAVCISHLLTLSRCLRGGVLQGVPKKTEPS